MWFYVIKTVDAVRLKVINSVDIVQWQFKYTFIQMNSILNITLLKCVSGIKLAFKLLITHYYKA